ncbi:MAG: TVP38/TMEM64 family protein [Deltaproteobacteria bacterium]|nr:TVP38/TMEM64 family protein [Deltaproteobacteria bacterium]
MLKRWLLVLLFVAAAVVAWATGLYEHLSIESIRSFVLAAGWLGPPLFVALFLVQGMALVPGFPFLLAAGFIWPPWQAFALNMAGSLASCLIGFFYARTLGRELVAARLPARMRRFEAAVVERAVPTVIAMRMTFYLAPYAHWAMGLSPVSLRAYVLGSFIGCLPWVIGFTFFGRGVLEWLGEQSPHLWFALGGIALLVLMALVWRRVTSGRQTSGA